MLLASIDGKVLTDQQIAANAAYYGAVAVAARVFEAHRIKNRFLLIYQSETPLVATWKTYLCLSQPKPSSY